MRFHPFFALLLLAAASFSLHSCAKQDPFVGMWAWEVTDTPEGNFSGEMAVSKDGDAYSGMFMGSGQSSPMKNVAVSENTLTFETQTGGYYIEVTGNLAEESMTGNVAVEGFEFPFKATKMSDKVSTP